MCMMMASNVEGRFEIETARQRVATAKAHANSANDDVLLAKAMMDAVKSMTDGPDSLVHGSEKEVEDAENDLKEFEQRLDDAVENFSPEVEQPASPLKLSFRSLNKAIMGASTNSVPLSSEWGSLDLIDATLCAAFADRLDVARSHASKALEVAIAMELLAKTNLERAQENVKSCQQELMEAEKALVDAQERWQGMNVVVENESSCGINFITPVKRGSISSTPLATAKDLGKSLLSNNTEPTVASTVIPDSPSCDQEGGVDHGNSPTSCHQDLLDTSAKNEGQAHAVVEGAGCPEVNGVYNIMPNIIYSRVPVYIKQGKWKGYAMDFVLMHRLGYWYISVGHSGVYPNTRLYRTINGMTSNCLPNKDDDWVEIDDTPNPAPKVYCAVASKEDKSATADVVQSDSSNGANRKDEQNSCAKMISQSNNEVEENNRRGSCTEEEQQEEAMQSPGSPTVERKHSHKHTKTSSLGSMVGTCKIEFGGGDVYEGNVVKGKAHGQGKYTYSDGSFYEGAWVKDKYHGLGKYTCVKTGTVYDGQWKDNKYHGFGKKTHASGRVYEGEWKYGRKNGQGKNILADGSIYEGEWKDDKRHGQGKKIFIDGGIYEGEWKDNKRHGQGKLECGNGDVYEGNWDHGKVNGKGKYTYSGDGSIYDGVWKNEKRHGIGKLISANGDVYEGDWREDKPHGKGKCTYDDGSVYEGEWVLQGRHGAGTMNYSNGNVYQGQWRCGHKDGTGIMTFADGGVYDGEWLNDCRHGNGTMTEANGDVYQGEWSGDRKHGVGYLKEASGEERQQVYNYGNLLEICSEVMMDQSDHSTTVTPRGRRSSLGGSWLVRSRSMSIRRLSQEEGSVVGVGRLRSRSTSINRQNGGR